MIPTGRNEDGLVALVLNKKENDVSSVQQQVVDTITRILARPTLSVCVEGIRPMPEDRLAVHHAVIFKSFYFVLTVGLGYIFCILRLCFKHERCIKTFKLSSLPDVIDRISGSALHNLENFHT